MICRFAAGGHCVVATDALLGRTFKHTADVARFASNELMPAGQREAGSEMIEGEPLIRDHGRLRAGNQKKSGGKDQAHPPDVP